MSRATKIGEREPPARSSRRGLTRAGEVRAEPTAVYSRASFCKAHGLSESFYFKLRDQGLGPDEMRLGTRVFVTHEAAARWRAARERASMTA
jgi:hypothetical protein